MPCLEPVLMISAGSPCASMPGRKSRLPLMTPSRLTPRIVVPVGLSAEDRRLGADAGVVHQHVDAAEALDHGAFEAPQRIRLRRRRSRSADHMLFARHIAFNDRLRLASLSPPRSAMTTLMPSLREMFRRGKPDAGSAAGDDRDVGFLDDVLDIRHGPSLSSDIVSDAGRYGLRSRAVKPLASSNGMPLPLRRPRQSR